MRRLNWFICVFVVGISVTRSRAAAQQRRAVAVDSGHFTEDRYAAWMAGTWHAPISNHRVLPDNRALLIVGVERRYDLSQGGLGVLSFSPALLPAVYTTGNRRDVSSACGGSGFPTCITSVRYSTFGVGVLPIAFIYSSPSQMGVGINASIDGGAIRFTDPIPASTGTAFNFIARVGIDLRVAATSRAAVFGGYRHIHISNGGLGATNAGIDAPAFVLGWQWR